MAHKQVDHFDVTEKPPFVDNNRKYVRSLAPCTYDNDVITYSNTSLTFHMDRKCQMTQHLVLHEAKTKF